MPYKKNYSTKRRYSSKKYIVKPKRIWSVYRQHGKGNMFAPIQSDFPAGYDFLTKYEVKDIIQNLRDDVNIPQAVRTIKHLKVELARSYTGCGETMRQACMKMKAYLLYLPQGVTFNSTMNKETMLAETLSSHPEWVLSEKSINSMFNTNTYSTTNHTINCKLSKNLRSGDRIALVIAASFDPNILGSTDNSKTPINFNYEYTYACC